METLHYGLRFERVVVLFADSDKTVLTGRMSIGNIQENVRDIKIPLDGSQNESVFVKAFQNGLVEVYGEPLLVDGYPYAAIPIGIGEHARGVIYVDRVSPSGDENLPIDGAGIASLAVLCELLEQSVSVWD